VAQVGLSKAVQNLDYAGRKRSFVMHAVDGKSRKIRIWILATMMFFFSALLITRLFHLQIVSADRWQEFALKQHFAEVQIASERGTIVDRNNRLLAVSVPASSVYVRPRLISIEERSTLAAKLAATLKLPVKQVIAKLSQKEPFVWLDRQIPRERAELTTEFKHRGVGTIFETKRYYPYGKAASTLIGKVGLDGKGLSGIELKFEKNLQVAELNNRMTRDALGNRIEPSFAARELEVPRGGSLTLTIDANIQLIMDEELELARRTTNAKHTFGVMLDSRTGEILGLAQTPGTDFNRQGNASALKNLVIETVYEPGSTLKPIVAAAALEAGVVAPSDMIDCEAGSLTFARHVINDTHPYDLISFRDVIVRSSNIGMTKIGARLGADRLYESLQSFGFGAASGLGLVGESRGILRKVSSWAQIDVATHSFGQGLSVTPLQMVRGIAALANGGVMADLRLLESEGEFRGHRVVSERVAKTVQDMMYGVVEDEHGTGANAKIGGIRVGGKTGTAQKPNPQGRGYLQGAYIASFVGFADGRDIGVDRNLSLIVIVDEARSTSIYGGTLAAPAFKRIMQRSFAYLATAEQLVGSSLPPQAGRDTRAFDIPQAGKIPHTLPVKIVAMPQI
jgi:cell division protein FtsI (penicillin-binding protein 3)